MTKLSKGFNKLNTGIENILGMIGLIGILVITANAFCRFILKISMAWSDELLRTIMIYGYFIGAAVMFYQGGCMRLELLDGALKHKDKPYRILNLILGIINTVFWGLMSYFSYNMMTNYIINGTTQSTSSTPAWILVFGCAIGMTIITITSLVNIIKCFKTANDNA